MKKILVGLIVVSFLIGCSSKVPRTIVPNYTKKGIRLIALMPIKDKAGDAKAAQIFRNAILDDLYFKGYPKIPLHVIDENLEKIYGSAVESAENTIPPQTVGEVLGVDAVMYCTLEEWKTSFWLFCAPTTVAASFELRSARTGETLWGTAFRAVKRNYDFTSKGLELKSRGSCDEAAQEVVEKAMSTLPTGPDYPGSPPKEKHSFLGLW